MTIAIDERECLSPLKERRRRYGAQFTVVEPKNRREWTPVADNPLEGCEA